MAKTSIALALRSEVIERARKRCEYCHMPNNQELNAYPHEVDHVTAKKHGGQTTTENLAYACFDCNRHKGTDLSSIDPHTGQITQLFTPVPNSGRSIFSCIRMGQSLHAQQRAERPCNSSTLTTSSECRFVPR